MNGQEETGKEKCTSFTCPQHKGVSDCEGGQFTELEGTDYVHRKCQKL